MDMKVESTPAELHEEEQYEQEQQQLEEQEQHREQQMPLLTLTTDVLAGSRAEISKIVGNCSFFIFLSTSFLQCSGSVWFRIRVDPNSNRCLVQDPYLFDIRIRILLVKLSCKKIHFK